MGRHTVRFYAATLALGAFVSAGAESVSVGTLRGSVTLGRHLAAHRMKFNLYADGTRVERPEPPTMQDELENVVVYLEHAPEGATSPTAPRGPFRMEQEGLAFKPHVLAIEKGTQVEFPNRDMLFHNVFSLSRPATFDLGRFPQSTSKSLTFTKSGIVKVFCHIHSDMSGVIMVLDNPFFAAPDRDGRFVIEGIPPGEYRVFAWHERAHLAVKHVRIEAGRPAELSFEIPLTEDENGG